MSDVLSTEWRLLMAVYLACERCGGGSFGDRYCESCERGFAAHPESRPTDSLSSPSNTDTEPRQNRLLRLVAMKQAEREGWLDILKYAVEYDAYLEMAGVELRPDMYVDLGVKTTGTRHVTWLEIDRGGERERQILDKVRAYVTAWQHRSDYPLDVFPSIMFLATDEQRAKAIRGIIKKFGSAPGELFQVATIGSYPQILRA
ncbi:hypothetical protein HQO42_05325 [Rhodococcus fascians]|nr:hypothetical protein [Rhodococcus fascians]MBY4236574.1 hypothetical protein [Rhodococcus fascians]MBY4252060.1 hypothetical protein [Rhodococcus fascians]